MTTAQQRRLIVLEAHRRRRPPPPAPSTFDAARLRPRERHELDRLLAPHAPRPGESWNLDGLSVEELEQVCALVRKGHGLPAPAPFAYMAHRPASLGPCWCAGDGCGRETAR